MGATLVGDVLLSWTHLPDSAFRALIRMAHSALDNHSGSNPPNLYFGGHKLVAMTLRAGVRGGSVETQLRQARRAIQDLIEAGAIRKVADPQDRGTETYELTLKVTTKPVPITRKRRNKPKPPSGTDIVDSVEEGSCTPEGEGYRTPPPRGTSTLVDEGSCTPTEEALRGTTDELRDDQVFSVRTSPTDARETGPHEHEGIPSHSHVAVADPRCSYHGLPNTAPAGEPHRCRLWIRDVMCGQPKPVSP